MKFISFLLIAIVQIASIKSDQSCGVDNNAIELYCPTDYTCCSKTSCCSSTEFCSGDACVSYLLVVFGPLSLILFIVAIYVNIIMNKKEQQYRNQLKELSEPDAQIHLPHQDDPSEEEDYSQNIPPENNQAIPQNVVQNDEQTALPSKQIPQKNKNEKQINTNNEDETADYQLNIPFLNKQSSEEEEEQKENNNKEDDQQTVQHQNFNFNFNKNKNHENNQQEEDKTYSVFKKND